MVLAWENLRRFLWWWSSLCCCYSSFVVFPHSHFLFDIIPHPSVDYSPAHCRVICSTFNFNHFVIFWPRALRFWVDISYPQGVFTLCSFPTILAQPAFIKVSLGVGSCFLEIGRASYWSSKHRPSPSVYLIHSNPQCFIHLKSVFIHVNIAKVFTCVVKTLIIIIIIKKKQQQN